VLAQASPVGGTSATELATQPPAALTSVVPANTVSPASIATDTGAVVASEQVTVFTLSASMDTWVEVTDGAGRLRIQRVLKQGEEIAFADGTPYAVVVGNAAGAQVLVRGKPLDLAAIAKNNVARFEVK